MEQYGIFQVTVPLPFWNDSVHCYLGRHRGKWTIIDTGINGHVTQKTWEDAFAAHQISPRQDVERIFLTHHHADHFGFANVIQEWTDAPLHLTDQERELARFSWTNEAFQAFYRACGLPDEMVSHLAENPTAFVQPLSPFPNKLERLVPGEPVQFGELLFEAIHTPGHTPGHICYYNRSEKIMITGDHLTRETIPYISYHGYGDENPLATYLNTLHTMQGMEISLVLPGHGPVFSDVQERIAELLRHYETRLHAVYEQVTAEKSAYEIAQGLAPADLPTFQQWILLGEVNAYLRFLAAKGELQIIPDPPVIRFNKR